jgi:two-component system chemotaxis response regulator CheB
VVAVGGSAGALKVMRGLAGKLPADLPAVVLVVLHVSADSPGLLAKILSDNGPLPASFPHLGERALPGHIYVAPPDRHLLLDPGVERRGYRLTLSNGARENRHRPAIDTTFRSVAAQAGSRAIGVVLSGLLDDGAAGAAAIKAAGGRLIVQDPDSAEAGDMPANALRAASADAVVPAGQIAAQIAAMLAPTPSDGAADDTHHDGDHGWHPSEFACPECHGVLMHDGARRFRCRTGHAYGIASLAAEYSAGVENALWIALRILREKAALAGRMATYAAPESGRERFEQQAHLAGQQADRIRDMIEHLSNLVAKA